MALGRDDRFVTDALGRALAGAQVYWCQPQPASTANNPPSPLASTYTDSTGSTPLAQPVLTDGFGHAAAYLDGTQPFTVVVWHPLFGTNPIVLPDQWVAQEGGGATGLTPAQASTTAGTITGSGINFTLPSVPAANSLVLQRNGQVLTPGLGYGISGANITLALALGAGDNLNANYFTAA